MKKKSSLFLHIASNLALVFLLFSISIVCFWPLEEEQTTNGEATEGLYRRSAVTDDGVSLMFNVYQGTDEVYEILKILDENQAKCTFFIGGCWADDNVECLRNIVEKGHELGNHGYFHKDHAKLSETDNKLEISRCNEFIRLACGVTPTLFAPPSGSYSDACLNAVLSLQMKTILWSKDTIDWRDQDSALIFNRATKNIDGGDFVLMHPTKATVEALDDVLANYTSKNLRVITVTENLRLGG